EHAGRALPAQVDDVVLGARLHELVLGRSAGSQGQVVHVQRAVRGVDIEGKREAQVGVGAAAEGLADRFGDDELDASEAAPGSALERADPKVLVVDAGGGRFDV